MATNTWTDVTCPSACGATLNYGALPSDPTCVSPPPLSEINYIFIIPSGASDCFDYSGGNPVAVSGAIDNTNTDNTKCKQLPVVGEIGDPEETIYNGPNGSESVSLRRYTLEGRTPINATSVYDFLRQLQCNAVNFTFRYSTRGGYLFGGANAISPVASNARLPKVAGNDGFEEGTAIIQYETTNGDPPRHPNPLA